MKKILINTLLMSTLMSCAHESSVPQARKTASVENEQEPEVILSTSSKENIKDNDNDVYSCDILLLSPKKDTVSGNYNQDREVKGTKVLQLKITLNGDRANYYYLAHIKDDGSFVTYDYYQHNRTKEYINYDSNSVRNSYLTNDQDNYAKITFREKNIFDLSSIKKVEIVEKAGLKGGSLLPSFKLIPKVTQFCKF